LRIFTPLSATGEAIPTTANPLEPPSISTLPPFIASEPASLTNDAVEAFAVFVFDRHVVERYGAPLMRAADFSVAAPLVTLSFRLETVTAPLEMAIRAGAFL